MEFIVFAFAFSFVMAGFLHYADIRADQQQEQKEVSDE